MDKSWIIHIVIPISGKRSHITMEDHHFQWENPTFTTGAMASIAWLPAISWDRPHQILGKIPAGQLGGTSYRSQLGSQKKRKLREILQWEIILQEIICTPSGNDSQFANLNMALKIREFSQL